MGFEVIISGLIKKATKSVVNFEIAIDPLLAQFANSCPSKPELDKIIKQKNQLSQALTQTQGALTTLTDTSTTINGVITGVDIAVKIIKALPLPTSVPPGIGIPLNVINGFSSALDKLGDILKSGKATVGQVAPALKTITTDIAKIQDKLSQLDKSLAKCLEAQTMGMTDEEKEAYFTSLGIDLKSTPTTGDGTQPGETLEDRLSPNSTNPYVYKDYTIILDTNSGNKFSFPERRAIATNKAGEQIVGPWSYSASTQVLVDGVKFQIDKLNKLALRAADEAAAAEAIRLEAERQAELARKKALAEQEKRVREAYDSGKKAGLSSKPVNQNPYPSSNKLQYDAWISGWKEGALTAISSPPPTNLIGALIPPSNTNTVPSPTTSTPDLSPFGFTGEFDGETRTFTGGGYLNDIYKWNESQDKWIKQ